MKKLALGLVGLIAACGGGGAVKLIDSSVTPVACDPVLQTGCATGEKCTWIIDLDPTSTADGIGHAGCAAAGATADGAVCARARQGVNAGADSCVAGDLCLAGRCKPICNPDLISGAGNGACADKFSCSLYQGVFQAGENASAGVCEPACDPLTQEKLVGDNKPACGSPDPANPTFTCVPASGFKSFSCAPNIDDQFTATDGQSPITDPRTGDVFINSCSPGYIALTQGSGSTLKNVCAGMCSPVKVDADTNPMQAPGSPTALGKLIHDAAPVAGNATCFSDKKGSVAGTLEHGDPIEDCRFIWTTLANGNQGEIVESPYNDTLGLCLDYNSIMVDTNVPRDNVPDTTLVSCAKLPAVIDATHPDVTKLGSAKDNGCYPLAETLPRSSKDTATRSHWNNPHRTVIQRLAYGPGAVARHVFD